MRGTRLLLLLAILCILAGVGTTYYLRKGLQSSMAPAKPKSLAGNIQAASRDWVYFRGDGQRPVVEIRARNMERTEDPTGKVRLEGVELRLFHKDGREYDRVRSASAQFDEEEGALFSDGQVEITLAVPAEGEKAGRLMRIRSSGVRFDSATGKATTDRPASFAFDLGEGSSIGASYDPGTRELRMHGQVELTWRGSRPDTKPMRVEAGSLVYRENESQVHLSPWARLTRDTLTLETADAVVTLEGGAIRLVEARQAKGSDRQPARQIRYSAESLVLNLTPESVIEKITAEGAAALEALAETARTSLTGQRLDLSFDVSANESLLREALATGQARLDSVPRARAGRTTPPSRMLRSEVIGLKMRSGGEEVELIETHTPGTLEFTPNAPGQRRRELEAFRMWIHYGPGNRVRSYRAVEVATRSYPEPPARAGGRPAEVARTWSKNLDAELDPDSGEVVKLRQWQEFRYEEGERKASAEGAVLEVATDRVRLETSARVSDATGSVAADMITLDQKTGDFTAEGRVRSTRLPDSRTSSGGMLSQQEPLQATAARMESAQNRGRIVYEGDAVLWQGASRLRADRVIIDRGARSLHAEGSVFSRLLDGSQEEKGKKTSAPVFTLIRSATLDYSDKERVAHYRGGVRMDRAGMEVRSRELRAYLKEAKEGSDESSLERAYADGGVEILEVRGERTRRGSAEHAEYYVAEEKVVLKGGHPQMVDSVKGMTRGRQLTYFSRNDSLLVEGAETQPVVSKIRRN